jgi:predicted deacetylase
MSNLTDQQEQQQQQPHIPLGVVTIHDACPAFSTNIFESADELERLNIKYNIALVPFFNEKQDLPSFPEFVDKIKSYKNCDIVLHGLYHEIKNGQFDDFHTVTEAAAEEQIRAGLEIFHEIGINTNVFIPPAWKLNNSSIKVLEKLGFKLAEMQEEYILLLSHQDFEKIKLPKVLNWDSTGYPEKNIVNVGRAERAFKLQVGEKPQIIRIALHPRDPTEAIEDQKQMIAILKDSGYEIPTYTTLMPKLEELIPSTHLD